MNLSFSSQEHGPCTWVQFDRLSTGYFVPWNNSKDLVIGNLYVWSPITYHWYLKHFFNLQSQKIYYFIKWKYLKWSVNLLYVMKWFLSFELHNYHKENFHNRSVLKAYCNHFQFEKKKEAPPLPSFTAILAARPIKIISLSFLLDHFAYVFVSGFPFFHAVSCSVRSDWKTIMVTGKNVTVFKHNISLLLI